MAREEPVTTGPGEAPTTPPSPARPGRPGGLGRRAIRIARRAQIRSPVLQGLTALAIYLAVWLTYAPVNALLAHPTVPRLSLESGDPSFFAWTLRWWPYAISHHINPLYTTQIRVPGGFGLTWITSVPALGVLAAPLTETMGPVASFNLLNVLALPLTAWAAFVLCRRLTRRFWPSLVGGAVFGFSAYEMVHSAAGDLDLTYSLLLPIIGYLVLLWWDGAIGDGRFVTLTGLALAAQFYLFLETFADMTALLAAALIVGFVLAAFLPGPGRAASRAAGHRLRPGSRAGRPTCTRR